MAGACKRSYVYLLDHACYRMLILFGVAFLLGVHDACTRVALVAYIHEPGAFVPVSPLFSPDRLFQDPVQPPMLLALALPHLPSPLPAIVTNGMKYLQIGGVFFDDISALIVGIGLLVWAASWVSS